jgi:flagellar biosynthesis GTPase FlhF
MAAVLDKKALMRDKRAQGIAAMGLVNREGDRFRVTTPTLRGRRASYEVWRDETGRVRCTCLEFEEQSAAEPRYRCEHILAVKHAVLNKNTEAAAKQSPRGEAAPQAQGATPDSRTAPGPDTTTQPASEKHGEAAAEVKAPRKTPRFVREQNEQPEVSQAAVEIVAAAETQERSLADNEETEELEMTKKATAHKPADEQEFITAEEYEEQSVAPVVPLSFAKTLSTLKQPVDPRLIKTREGWRDRNGNQHMVEYVEWHTVADILDRVAPTWSHSVRGIVQIGDMVAVTCAITIDGVTREGVGTGTADNETGIKKAEHDALKRAAIKFGIARELYQRESEIIESSGAGPQPGDFPKDPLAKSMADLVTPKQLGMIRALAREAGVDPDEESQSVMRVRTEELSKRAASSFIDHLKGLGREQTFEVRRAS